MLARTELVEDTSQRPDVALVIVWLLFAELGREVVRCSNYGVCKVLSLLEFPCNSKVPNFDLAFFSDEKIHCFDVSMQNFSGMKVLNSQAGLDEESPNFVFFNELSHLSLEVFLQIPAFTVLHNNKDGLLLLETCFVLYDVRVLKSFVDYGFSLSFLTIRRVHFSSVNHLHNEYLTWAYVVRELAERPVGLGFHFIYDSK